MKFPKVLALLVVLPLLLISTGAGAQSTQRFASVYKITGSVVATDSTGQQKRELKQGDTLFVGEQVRATATGEAVLRTDDAGVIAVRPNAAFVMEQFTANGNAGDNLSVRILTGALRMITGWTGYYNKERHRILTPSATVGIRGTDHEPYVLSAEMSVDLQMPEGTYNKVNSGGTVLSANGVQLDVSAGRVGFAPAKSEMRPRALLTVLMPSLLEKVPGFFVAGAFDSELEALAAADMTAAAKAGKLSGAVQTAAVPEPGAAPTAGPMTGTSTVMPEEKLVETGNCRPVAIATQWLQELDMAVVNKDGQTFLDKFDSQSKVVARVRDGAGNPVELSFTRDELVKSTFASFAQLSNYASRRPVIKAVLSAQTRPTQCDRIDIESVAIESGTRNGGSYRAETLETYKLVKRSGKWVALQATTSMR
jgi:hypothetical protein